MSSIFKNISYLYFVRAIGLSSPLLLIPHLFKVLGPETFGKLFFAQSFVLYFGIFIDFGFELYAPGKIAAIPIKRDLEKLVTTIQLVKITLGLCFLLVMAVFLYFMDDLLELNFALAWFFAILMQASVPSWFFQGIGDLSKISTLQALGKGITVLLTVVLVKTQADSLLFPLFEGGITLLISLLAWRRFFKMGYSFRKVEALDIIETIKESFLLMISRIAISLYTVSGPFILGLVSGPRMVAYFTAPMKIIETIGSFMGPINQVLYPYISSHVSQKTGHVNSRFLKKYLLLCLGAVSVLSIGLFVFKDMIVYDYLKAKDEIIESIFKTLALVPIFVFLSNVLGIQVLLGFGFRKEFTKIIVTSSLLGFSIIYIATFYHGAIGTSVSILLTEFLICVWMFMLVNRKIF